MREGEDVEKIFLFLIPMIISAIFVPLVKKIAWRLDIYAVENERTVHKGKIARIGGVAVFLAFMGCLPFFMDMDAALSGILLGGFFVFIGGLLDDMYNLPAIGKIGFQSVGALCAMIIGDVYLVEINLPFGLMIDFQVISMLVTFVWIIGITNAVNLIDGLDGLSSGFSIIVLLTIAILTTLNGRADVMIICLALAGATAGFLCYNFHPASIFIGDCGAQYLGYMISTIALLGFKGGTFITLVMPIIILFVPIMDTFIAIIRRKLSGKRISDPDKNHLHHTLMRTWKLGQRETVLIIYGITMMFSFAAYLFVVDEMLGLVLLAILIFVCELFVEVTGMIHKKYHPIMGLLDKVKKHTTSGKE
ncbi:MAG: undecaprenyl/decaprenyl-phosphate alpha-N-acetylglucosaminyl 1-phosphate transferase [Erysipelotrichaceae bacterium]|nr:undecaprenyl/decaprenyl-phosphate alpha-N-acetylglucosaminyl 1-phosphate transferase [Erysipelotrichaceae bacterium]